MARSKKKNQVLVPRERLSIRPYLPSDGPAIVDLAARIRSAEPSFPLLDSARWRYVCADPHAKPEENFGVLKSDLGECLGVAYRLDPPRIDGGRYRAVFVAVDPRYRRQGLGWDLYEATVGDDVPASQDPGWFLSTTLDDASETGKAFAKALGLKPVFTRLVLERNLPGRALPDYGNDSVTIQSFVGAHAFEDWAHIHNASYENQRDAIHHDPVLLSEHRPDGFRPEHLRFAKIEKLRVGYLFLRETADGGHIESVGVLPQARGKGVGTALALDALRYLRERGHRNVNLVVDEKNLSALQLYARLGFEECGRRVHLQRPARKSKRRRPHAK